jgi:hypothetical protein
VFSENGVPIHVEHLAHQIRCDLRRVGVTRPQLFESSETRQRFRAHDLRATFVTIALATGKTETWVSDRNGHDGLTMVDKYRRKARTWNVGELGRLDRVLPGSVRYLNGGLRLPLDCHVNCITARVTKQGRRSGFRFLDGIAGISGLPEKQPDRETRTPEIDPTAPSAGHSLAQCNDC